MSSLKAENRTINPGIKPIHRIVFQESLEAQYFYSEILPDLNSLPGRITEMKPSKFATLTQEQVEDWVNQAKAYIQTGHLPEYIPFLAGGNPNWFAVHIQSVDGQQWTAGDHGLTFALMSLIKPFLLLYLLEQFGEDTIFSRVGMEPSDQPFNSLVQLQIDRGFPRNPMINSGAIALCSLIPGESGAARCDTLCEWLQQQTGCSLQLDSGILSSVKSLPNQQNWTIAQELSKTGHLATDAAIALDTYERICCLSGTVSDLAQLGMMLVQSRVKASHRHTVIAIMLTCGLYQHSGQFAVKVGVPTKSGVSGALLSVVPGEGAIACYSPPLDFIGNSVGGLAFLRSMTPALGLSIFG